MRILITALCLTSSGLLLLGGCAKKHDDTAGTLVAPAVDTAPAIGGSRTPKPGLWQTTVSTAGMPKPMTMQMCVGAPTPGASPFIPPLQAGQRCAKSAVIKTGTGYTVDLACEMNGMTMTTKGEVSGDFSSRYRTVMTTALRGPNMPAAMQAGRTSTAESTYLGACPTGMKPGAARQAG